MDEQPRRTWRTTLGWSVFAFVVLVFGVLIVYAHFFGPVDTAAGSTEFLVAPDESIPDIAQKLESEHIVRNALAVQFALLRAGVGKVPREGGYSISASMDTPAIADTLLRPPYLVWISIPRGQRKEQIAERLADALAWTPAQKDQWLTVDTSPSPSLTEGVYFPTTYLIPADQSPAEIAARMRAKFSDVYTPLIDTAAKKDEKWTSIITIASMIEREAKGPSDMALISGIMWNRIQKNMPLGIDATLQYIKGTSTDWWPTVHGEDKYLASPFNTYFKSGLPPHPIANPSKDALAAALNPEKTTCLFYLHDYKGLIHCSNTYKQHVANINKYLR